MENPILKTIPASGEQLPAIGMGTWQTFDVGSSESKRAVLSDVLRLFVEKGGRLIDSSPMYGSSEEVVGDLSRQLGLQSKLFEATKVWTRGEEEGIRQIEASAQLLQAPVIDLLQVHNLVDYKTHLRTLQGLKERGKIRYIGITHYTTSAYPDLMRVMREFQVDFVQFNYSLETPQAEEELLPFAADKGVAVLINRPFEGGSMFARVKGKSLPPWSAEMGCSSWGQFFLKWIIAHPAVTCAIPATANPKHLADNMGALYGPLPDADTRAKMQQYYKSL